VASSTAVAKSAAAVTIRCAWITPFGVPVVPDDRLRRSRRALREAFEHRCGLGRAPGEPCAAFVEDRGELALEQARVEPDGDAAGPDGAEVGDDPVDRVRREDQHAVVGREPARAPDGRRTRDRVA
jgi:hypothetical protein